MKLKSGRERDAQLIRQANRAAAVGRLMLGEFQSWHEFLEADVLALENLPRRNLRSGRVDVRERLSSEIKNFCSKNFRGMTARKLSELYELIKANRGIEIPLPEFGDQFAPVRKDVLRGNPAHLTVSLSLWGLKLRFPEDELARDIIEAMQLGSEAQRELKTYETSEHSALQRERERIGVLLRKQGFAARSAILSCFNLMEAYLNGLAWDYLQHHDTTNLSNRRRKLLDDTSSTSIRDKLLKYPEIISGQTLWNQPDDELDGFIDIVKPFRDSLVHPSPFSAPAKFGGYDKLRMFYRIDFDTAEMTAKLLVVLIERIHSHVHGNSSMPDWMKNLVQEVNAASGS